MEEFKVEEKPNTELPVAENQEQKLSLNPATVGMVLGLLALGISLYNTMLIKQNQISSSSVVSGIVGEAPEKILKELPKEAPVLGNADVKLTIIEFGDFQCPYCGQWYKNVYPQIKKDYIDTGKVKFIYLDFAFLGQESKDAAEAAHCAQEQGKYWEYHDTLFENQNGENQGNFNVANLKKFATNVELDLKAFEDCIADTKYDQLITEQQSLGGKYGVSGTPNFLIGKNAIRGVSNFSNFKQIIDQQL